MELEIHVLTRRLPLFRPVSVRLLGRPCRPRLNSRSLNHQRSGRSTIQSQNHGRGRRRSTLEVGPPEPNQAE